MHCSAEFSQFNEAQAFEISALQEAGPEAGLAAQLGGILANAVEADVERQVTSAVEGKKQVKHKKYSSYCRRLANFCRIPVQFTCRHGALAGAMPETLLLCLHACRQHRKLDCCHWTGKPEACEPR